MTKDLLIASGVVLAAIVVATVLVVRDFRQTSLEAVESPGPTQIEVPVAPVKPPPRPATAPNFVAPQTQPARAAAPLSPAPQRGRAAPRSAPNPRSARAPITEPLARDALSRIGADPDADIVFIAAINDTSLSANDRRNLIEDLNETGFENPANLTAADLPVIEYRLALLEQLAPDAADDVNAAAFDEAFKDLSNMRARLVGQ